MKMHIILSLCILSCGFSVYSSAVLLETKEECIPSVTTISGTHKPDKICSGQLIFNDDFDTLDVQKWEHENTLAGGGNWEFQWYTNNRTSSFVKNGNLHIKPTLLSDQYGEQFLYSGTLDVNGGAPADACTNPQFYGCSRTGSKTNLLNAIKSARLRTVNSFNFRYGKVEVRAKNPTGDWLWPAIWLMPRYNAYGSWPASGEIDLMESRGNTQLVENGKNIGTELVGSTLHYGPDYFHNAYMKAHFEKSSPPGQGYNLGFHNYSLEWTPEYIKFSYDGVEVGTVKPSESGFWGLGEFANSNVANPWEGGSKMSPFDQEFYIILNLAVGGIAYFPDNAQNPNGKPWSNQSPTAGADFWNGRNQWLPTWKLDQNNGYDASLIVDYVKVYAL